MNTLVLAIDDPEVGERIRKTRISTPPERTIDSRIVRVRTEMEKVGALDDTKKGKKYQAKLELIPEKPGLLLELEDEFLDKPERFLLGEWTQDSEFIIHDEAVAITAFVIDRFRPALRKFRIAVVMAEKIAPVLGRGRLGTATKLPGKMRFLSEWDALITLDFSRWRMLTDRDRQRLIHHELEHLDEGEEGLRLIPHDFEDFKDIIGLYGLRSESEMFSTDGRVAEVLQREAAQLELIPRSA